MIKPSVVELLSYAGYRIPPEVISYAVWRYFHFALLCFALSLCMS